MSKINLQIVFVIFSFALLFAATKHCHAQSIALGAGPGTEMTSIINRLGLGSDCQRCRDLATQMDRGGPDWVMQNFEHVIAHTVSNSENLGHRMGPIRRTGVRMIVRTAVRRSR